MIVAPPIDPAGAVGRRDPVASPLLWSATSPPIRLPGRARRRAVRPNSAPATPRRIRAVSSPPVGGRRAPGRGEARSGSHRCWCQPPPTESRVDGGRVEMPRPEDGGVRRRDEAPCGRQAPHQVSAQCDRWRPPGGQQCVGEPGARRWARSTRKAPPRAADGSLRARAPSRRSPSRPASPMWQRVAPSLPWDW